MKIFKSVTFVQDTILVNVYLFITSTIIVTAEEILIECAQDSLVNACPMLKEFVLQIELVAKK